MQINDEVEVRLGSGFWRLGRILARRPSVETWRREATFDYRVLIYGKRGGARWCHESEIRKPSAIDRLGGLLKRHEPRG